MVPTGAELAAGEGDYQFGGLDKTPAKIKNMVYKIDLKKLAEQNGYQCYWCHKKFPLDQLSRDHYDPKRLRMGKQGRIVLSCKPCNSFKADTAGAYIDATRRKQIVEEVEFDEINMDKIKRSKKFSH